MKFPSDPPVVTMSRAEFEPRCVAGYWWHTRQQLGRFPSIRELMTQRGITNHRAQRLTAAARGLGLIPPHPDAEHQASAGRGNRGRSRGPRLPVAPAEECIA